MLQRLFQFKGGVKPETHKAPSVQAPIGIAPLPARLIVPLHQSIGGHPQPLVSAGERVRKLADLLGREVKPLDAEEKPKQVAIIDEQLCIGCTLCIQACPVDAIVGAAKQMHTIVESLCTGCELCVKPCPVECIRMEAIPEKIDNWKWKYPVFQIKPVRRAA